MQKCIYMNTCRIMDPFFNLLTLTPGFRVKIFTSVHFHVTFRTKKVFFVFDLLTPT